MGDGDDGVEGCSFGGFGRDGMRMEGRCSGFIVIYVNGRKKGQRTINCLSSK